MAPRCEKCGRWFNAYRGHTCPEWYNGHLLDTNCWCRPKVVKVEALTPFDSQPQTKV